MLIYAPAPKPPLFPELVEYNRFHLEHLPDGRYGVRNADGKIIHEGKLDYDK